MTRIEACIVNHNTSVFTELALRSLAATHPAWLNDARLRVTVVDNHSGDDGLDELKYACRRLNVAFELSRWPAGETVVNSHGDVLYDFVAGRQDATHFLFVDTDTYFLTDESVGVMLAELTAAADAWAVQARFEWLDRNFGAGSSLDWWSGRPQQIWATVGGPPHTPFEGEYKPRCHPGCTLITNTSLFRRVSETIGLSAGIFIGVDQRRAGFADTLGPASLTMATHGLRYLLSSATVGHYHNVSYPDAENPIGGKLEDCRQRLAEFR